MAEKLSYLLLIAFVTASLVYYIDFDLIVKTDRKKTEEINGGDRGYGDRCGKLLSFENRTKRLKRTHSDAGFARSASGRGSVDASVETAVGRLRADTPSTTRLGPGESLPVFYLYSDERTGSYTRTAAYAHLHGQEHGWLPGLLLLQQLVAAGLGCFAKPVLGITHQGVASFEVNIGVFVQRHFP